MPLGMFVAGIAFAKSIELCRFNPLTANVPII